MVIEDGDVLELTRESAEKNGKVTAGRVCIDSGSTIDVVEDLVIRDRRTCPKTALCCPSSPSTGAPATWRTRRRW